MNTSYKNFKILNTLSMLVFGASSLMCNHHYSMQQPHAPNVTNAAIASATGAVSLQDLEDQLRGTLETLQLFVLGTDQSIQKITQGRHNFHHSGKITYIVNQYYNGQRGRCEDLATLAIDHISTQCFTQQVNQQSMISMIDYLHNTDLHSMRPAGIIALFGKHCDPQSPIGQLMTQYSTLSAFPASSSATQGTTSESLVQGIAATSVTTSAAAASSSAAAAIINSTATQNAAAAAANSAESSSAAPASGSTQPASSSAAASSSVGTQSTIALPSTAASASTTNQSQPTTQDKQQPSKKSKKSKHKNRR